MKPKEQCPLIRLLPGKTDKNDPGKWLPVWMHLEDTAGIMEKLVCKWLSPNISSYIESQLSSGDMAALCKLIAYLHDIGKFTPVFAARILEYLPDIRLLLEENNIEVPYRSEYLENTPHALAGQCILIEHHIPPGIAVIIGAHHGVPQDQLFSEDKSMHPGNYYGLKSSSDTDRKKWDDAWTLWIRYALVKSGFNTTEAIPNLDQPAQMLLTGLLIMADWIASNPAYFPLIDIDTTGNDDAYPDRIKRAWKKFDKNNMQIWSPSLYFADREAFCSRFRYISNNIVPNDVQKRFIDVLNSSDGKGIYILEAPMGCGKTEAALFAAEALATKTQTSGIFFGMPTQATANGIFTRLLPWAYSQSDGTVKLIRLAHGNAELNEEYRELFEGEASIDDEDTAKDKGALIVHEWFKGRKQALLSDFVIGTVDQMLLAGLSRRHVMLRHLGLAGKVVIIDECHAYDAYMNKYMDCVLRWLGSYGTPVILLSATLPAKRRTEIIKSYVGEKNINNEDTDWETNRGYPLLTWTEGNTPHSLTVEYTGRRTKVMIDRIRDEDITSELGSALSDGGCAGVIVNTVRRAQMLAELIEKSLPNVRVLLFHSQFIAPDRAEREKDLLNRIGKDSTPEQRNRLVIVGTQVLEQSLDIDFDYMITDLCPMDLLLQRIGRLHRHDRIRPKKLDQARCSVLGTSEEEFLKASELIYGKWMLEQTKRLLPEKIVLPDDIPDLVQDAYKDADKHENDWNEYIKNITVQQGKADQFCIRKPMSSKNIRNAGRNTIAGLLTNSHPGNTETAEACVRDGLQSISVLIMKEYPDGKIGFLPWSENKMRFDRDHRPDPDESRMIARQKMNLPYIFNLDFNAMKAINELEEKNKTVLPEWQQAGLLKGELILLLDKNNRTDLCGFHLMYDRDKGLVVRKEE